MLLHGHELTACVGDRHDRIPVSGLARDAEPEFSGRIVVNAYVYPVAFAAKFHDFAAYVNDEFLR